MIFDFSSTFLLNVYYFINTISVNDFTKSFENNFLNFIKKVGTQSIIYDTERNTNTMSMSKFQISFKLLLEFT